MSRWQTVQECDQAITAMLPTLPRPEQKALAALLSGVVFTRAATLSVASVGMPGSATNPSKLRRAQRLLANPRFRVEEAQARLAAQCLADRRGRVDLLLDATPTGATAQQAGTETLTLACAWHRRSLPLAWTSRQRGRGAHPTWRSVIPQLFDRVGQQLSADAQVVVMADRGLVGRPLLERITAQGWHYLLRCERTAHIRLPDGTCCTLGDLVPQPGAPPRCLTGVQVFARRTKRPPEQRHRAGQSTWYRNWKRAITTNVVAVWREGDADPWLLLTDLPARLTRCREYCRRIWEEEGFRDWKSSGWNWQKSRVRQPERVDRLLLVLALATLWMAALAQRLLRRGQRRLLEAASRRCYSYFQLSLRYLDRLLALDRPIPVSLHLLPEARAPVKLS
jgi:hypothetical protein